ncbi:hypothetical protein HRbin10_01926 [bacterium HR10]|nr:hypothetical protein HRbin10_01926 [bacterium HR10]
MRRTKRSPTPALDWDAPRPHFPIPPMAAFRSDYLDFERGIRIGRLEPEHRLTRLLKFALESAFGEPFVTVRWGRGLYWQWIGFFPHADRRTKASFGCAKYFVSLDREERAVHAGMQVERGYVNPPSEFPECRLRANWDWHRLVALLVHSREMERALAQLVKQDGFRLFIGSWEGGREFTAANFTGLSALRRVIARAPSDQWCGFQLFYALSEAEIRAMEGREVLEAILAIFAEVTPILSACWETSARRRQPIATISRS